MPVSTRTVVLPAEIGHQTCLGVFIDEYPINHGNCFGMSNHLPVVNMVAENFKEWIKRSGRTHIQFLEIESSAGDKWLLVDDPRIPKEWLRKEQCWCSSCPTELYELLEAHGLEPLRVCGCESPTMKPSLNRNILKLGGVYLPKREDYSSYQCTRCRRYWYEKKA